MEQIIVNEIWRSIDGYVDYQVSNTGRVRNANTGRILRPRLRGKGYEAVALYVNKVRSDISTHRIVAETFIPNPDDKPIVDHIDGNKRNNAVNNLRWCNNQDNIRNTGKINKPTTSKYKGVSWNKCCNKWVAQVRDGGKSYHLGCFDNEEEAALAYNEKAAELFGVFVHLNILD